MTPTQLFLDHAVKGVWKEGKELHKSFYPQSGTVGVSIGDKTDPEEYLKMSDILLDPLAWQAVGKTRGWGKSDGDFENRKYDMWQEQWHRFIDHLADGKTIDEALQAIE